MGWGREVDYNIFTDSLSYLAARQLGGDAHSIVAAIRFIDAAKGDFNVADDSEAIIKGGFRNFPMNNFGVLSFHLNSWLKVLLCPFRLWQVMLRIPRRCFGKE